MYKILESEAYKMAHELNKAHFSLALPIVCKITKSKKFCSKFAAMWTLKECANFQGETIEYHEIKISWCAAMDKPHFLETIAHELVHCQQWERGISKTPHNRAFFSRLDYVLAQIGLPRTAKEYRAAIKKY